MLCVRTQVEGWDCASQIYDGARGRGPKEAGLNFWRRVHKQYDQEVREAVLFGLCFGHPSHNMLERLLDCHEAMAREPEGYPEVVDDIQPARPDSVVLKKRFNGVTRGS